MLEHAAEAVIGSGKGLRSENKECGKEMGSRAGKEGAGRLASWPMDTYPTLPGSEPVLVLSYIPQGRSLS